MLLNETPQNKATLMALYRALALVLLPGAIFVLGLIYFVTPKRVPPPQTWADGTYTNPCCAPLTLRNGVISTGEDSARFVVSTSKLGNEIDVDRGISMNGNRVVFGGTFVFVYFNKVSAADPALGEAVSFHLNGCDGSRDYVFIKR